MLKACGKCGRIHPYNYKCTQGTKRTYSGGDERKERSSYAWTKKSKEIREKAQGLCEVCRAEGRYTYRGLEVHHIIKVKDNKDLLLDDYNLVCLCTEHHKKAEGGGVSMEFLKKLAEMRENSTYPRILSDNLT